MKSGAVNVKDSLNVEKLPLKVYVTGAAAASVPKPRKATIKDRKVCIG